MTVPTRHDLLALKHGDRITHGAMSAYRHSVDSGVRKKQIDPRQVVFSKHYIEGKLTLIVTDEMIADMHPDPWRMIEERLDEAAAQAGRTPPMRPLPVLAPGFPLPRGRRPFTEHTTASRPHILYCWTDPIPVGSYVLEDQMSVFAAVEADIAAFRSRMSKYGEEAVSEFEALLGKLKGEAESDAAQVAHDAGPVVAEAEKDAGALATEAVAGAEGIVDPAKPSA